MDQEQIESLYSGIHDPDGNFIGLMASWTIITDKLAREQREQQVLEKVAANAETLSSASEELTATSKQMVNNAEKPRRRRGPSRRPRSKSAATSRPSLPAPRK